LKRQTKAVETKQTRRHKKKGRKMQPKMQSRNREDNGKNAGIDNARQRHKNTTFVTTGTTSNRRCRAAALAAH
jgi:hypothetical protein